MKKILTAALLAGGLIVTTATAASAHHPIVSGVTDCADDGQQTITWTVSNSESKTGTNRTMEIDQVSIDRGEVGFTVGQDFAPIGTLGGLSSQSSTSTYDGDETGDVTLKVRVDFTPGADAPKDVWGQATVKLVGECVAVTTTSSSTSTSTSTSTTSTSTTTTTQPTITATVQPTVAEKAVVVPTEVLGVQLTAPAAGPTPVGGVQTGGGGTSQSGNPLLPFGVGLAGIGLILVAMRLRRPVLS